MKGVFNPILYQNRPIILEINVLEIFLGSVSASAQFTDPSPMLVFTNICGLNLLKQAIFPSCSLNIDNCHTHSCII